MGMTDQELVEKWNDVLASIDGKPSKDEVFDTLEDKASQLVAKGRFDSAGEAMSHLLEHDQEMREMYLRGTGRDHETGTRSVSKATGAERELERRAEKMVAKGEAETLGSAMTAILDEDDALAERYREGR